MPSSSGTEKICIVCATDCANKPRVKDAKGRYYCKPCHEQAQKQAKSVRQPARSAANISSNDGDDGSLNILDQLIDAAPPIASRTPCPNCGFAMNSDAIMCTNCGYNAKSHHAMRAPKIVKARKDATGGVIWPPLVGIVSIVFGGAGVLLNGFTLLSAIVQAMSGTNFKASLTTIASATLVTSLAAWLLRDGVRVLRRDSSAVASLRIWAIAKLAVYGSCLGLMLAIPSSQLDKMLSSIPQASQANITAANVKAVIELLLIWFAFWPAFVLIFFCVPRIQRDVAAWD